jgi:hypothetical protein
MSANVEFIFESRLRGHITALLQLQCSPQIQDKIWPTWQRLWDKYSLDFIMDAVSGIIIPQVKMLLAADRPPTIDEIKALPRVTNKKDGPGLYCCLLETPQHRAARSRFHLV